MPDKQPPNPVQNVKVKVGKEWLLLEATRTEEASENTVTYDVKSIKIAGVVITAAAMTGMFWALQFADDLVSLIKSLLE